MKSLATLFCLLTILIAYTMGQDTDPATLTLDRIFTDNEFQTKGFGPFKWLDEGVAYTTLENSPELKGNKDFVRYDTESGERTILVSATELIPAGAEEALKIRDYAWSADKSKLMIFTNTVKVWRDHTRGDYWIMDLKSRALRKVGAGAKPSTLMFAKFSPDGNRVAYVRENNIYAETLATGETIPLTDDGTTTLINGTFDWVYEEEFGLQDGFRWSPDGKHIAFWQLDASDIPNFYMINNTAELYPTLIPVQYPKVGTTNSSCRVGVVATNGGDITWMQVPGDPQNTYLPRLEWLANSKHLLISQLNRLQNHRIAWKGAIGTGKTAKVFEDKDDAWVNMRQKFPWYKADQHRLILSERDGWQHLYRLSLKDKSLELLTPGDYDVMDVKGMDESGGWIYFIASPKSATERYLYKVPVAGGKASRVSPAGEVGDHNYNIAPNGKWATHTFSAMGKPPVIQLISLPDHKSVRLLENNETTRLKLKDLKLGETSYFKVKVDTDTEVDGWMIKPPKFNPKKKYPVIFYVYSEPAGQTTRNRWGGSRYFYHQLLAQQGYLVVTVDNRGTPAPKGREWRKSIYGKIGIVNVADQAAAAREVMAWDFVDEKRVGVWGWSGGGSMTLNAMFQHPGLYHVGISVAPVANQKFYDTVYQERYMGLPKDNVEGFTQGSPITHAHRLEGKLLLIHGTGDDNVHYQNAEALVNELILHNKEFDMMAYPNRSHSIREGKNTSRHLYGLMLRYMSEHLEAGGKKK